MQIDTVILMALIFNLSLNPEGCSASQKWRLRFPLVSGMPDATLCKPPFLLDVAKYKPTPYQMTVDATYAKMLGTSEQLV